MTLADLLAEALRGIRLYRIRSLLLVVTFAAGTAAAIVVVAMTAAAGDEILRRLAELGSDVLVVRPLEARTTTALTVADAESLRGLPFVRAVAPLRTAESSVLLPDERVAVRVIGVTADYFRLHRLPFVRGGPFGDFAETAVSILGPGAARRLFPSGGAYGSLVKIGGNWYRIIGVLSEDHGSVGGVGAKAPMTGHDVYLPIAGTFRRDRSTRQALDELWVRLAPGTDPTSAAAVVTRSLARRHEGRRLAEVETAAALLREQGATRGFLDRLLALVSRAAFALGGIAMLALSWQATAERRREIAIRRALGATRLEILTQFVVEGVVLAGAGGIAGVVAGALFAGLGAWLGGWSAAPIAERSLTSLAAAVVVGGAATFVPAYRAALLDPVPALRFER